MFTQTLKVATIALLGASGLSVAHAQVSPLCADLGPYLESAMASEPFEALKNSGTIIYRPKALGGGYCNIRGTHDRPELTCTVSNYSPAERMDGDRRAVVEGQHENIRKNTIEHLKTCQALSGWTIGTDNVWAGGSYGQGGTEYLMTDPETGLTVGARTIVDRSGSKGRWQYQFSTSLVFVTPGP